MGELISGLIFSDELILFSDFCAMLYLLSLDFLFIVRLTAVIPPFISRFQIPIFRPRPVICMQFLSSFWNTSQFYCFLSNVTNSDDFKPAHKQHGKSKKADGATK